jgi:hypothetical protein
MNKIRKYLLMLELKTHHFTIIGNNECMVRIMSKRFLGDREVKQVKEWRGKGKIVKVGTSYVIGSCGSYTYTTYYYKK